LIQVEGIINSLNSFLTTQQGNVLNLRQQVEQTKLASFLILLFFDIGLFFFSLIFYLFLLTFFFFQLVAIIGLIFSFFVLWLSFTANVRENSWEYGVLRAVGLVVIFYFLFLFIYSFISFFIGKIVNK